MQFRIIRNNKSPIGYRYYIQKKYFGLFWFRYYDQQYCEFDLEMCKAKIDSLIRDNMWFNLRKQTENNKVM